MKKKILLSATILLLAACVCFAKTPANSTKKSIVCTTFPQYDWIMNILGDRASNYEVTLLMDKGTDLHSYQATFEDIAKISECDMFVYIGGESDNWVEKALKNASNKNMIVVNMMDILGDKVCEEEFIEGMQESASCNAEGHHHHHGHEGEDNLHYKSSDIKISKLTISQEVKANVKNQTGSEFLKGLFAAQDFMVYLKNNLTKFKGKIENDIELFIDTSSHSHDDEGIVHLTIIERKNDKYKTHNMEICGFKKSENPDHDKIENITELEGLKISTKSSNSNITVDNLVDEIEDSSDKLSVIFKYASKQGKLNPNIEIELFEDSLYSMEEQGTLWYRILVKAEKPYSKWIRLTGLKPETHDSHENEEEVEYDEHIWLSLKNAKIITEHLLYEIEKLDNENKGLLKANCAFYVKKLEMLDNEYEKTVASAKNNTLLFGDRFPFRYLIEDYKLSYYAAFVGCSAESEASFDTIIFLAKKINELNLNSILTIEKSNKKIAKTIKANTASKNQEILELNSMQSVTKKEIQKGTSYYSIMKENLEVLKKALN
ncbi:MAG: metal ABC transporter solute-binding protein, Zn/Mn family [Treponemataceae bacterium]